MPLREFMRRAEPFIRRLLSNYEPSYPLSWPVECKFCGKGPCLIQREEDRGLCGLSPEAVLARNSFSYVVIGMNTHLSSLERMIDYSRRHDFRSPREGVTTPINRAILDRAPEDLKEVQEIYEELKEVAVQISSVLHMGQEGEAIEYERWSLLGGLVDLLSLELAELIYTSTQPELRVVKRVSYGPQTVEKGKPAVLVIGHLPPVLQELIRWAGGADGIELLGLCCLGHEASRAHPGVKFVGSLNQQVKIVGSGIADVAVVDEQCVLPNFFEAAVRSGTKLICVSPKISYGLLDLSDQDDVDAIERIVGAGLAGGVVLDEAKAARVAIGLAKRLHGNKRPDAEESLKSCTFCGACERVCPREIELTKILEGLMNRTDVREGLADFWDRCTECLRCERVCPTNVQILGGLTIAWCELQAGKSIKSGRGSIADEEIRVRAPSLVLGSIPGTIILAGCPEFPGGLHEIDILAREFTSRDFVVLTTGCSATALAETGLYDGSHRYDPSSLINLGSCFANAHSVGTMIKAAHYQAKVDVDGNYPGVADFIHNKLSSCAALWGIVAPKTYATAHGAIAFGIPVIIPSRQPFLKMIQSRKGRIELYDVKWKRRVEIEHVPDHMLYTARGLDDCLLSIIRLCMRTSDTASARRRKLEHYLDLGVRLSGKVPPDVERYLRTNDDLPEKYARELRGRIREEYIPDTTILA